MIRVCLVIFANFLLLSCSASFKHKNDTYYFYEKNTWKHISNDFRYPTELEEHIEEFLGIPYLLGGSGKEGMDCSAFVKQVYAIYGIDLPRTSVLQSKLGIKVPRYALLPGDLVFFGESEHDSATHVGIYMGNNRFANATTSQGVKYSDLDESFFFSKYLFAKRLAIP
jgi:cell wall-associated NlpC family hydrolase